MRHLLIVAAVILIVGCTGQGEKNVNKGKDRPVPAGQAEPPKK